MTDKELMQRAWDSLAAWKEVYPENWDEEDERLMDNLLTRIAELQGEALRARLSQCERCGEKNPAEIHTCTPKREWQGLTDEDVWELAQKTPDFSETIAAIEAKLKEKNT